MIRKDNNILTPSQLTLILVGTMIGLGFLTLPNAVIQISKQDGWISCILGVLYPIYLVFSANYMCKKCPKENILILSKKCFGNILGNILNFIFILFFLFLITEVASGISNVLRIYMTPFLNNYKILSIIILIPAYIVYKGIKPIGRMNEVVFYSTLVMFLFPIGAIKEGSSLNIMPVLGSGIINILKGTLETITAYSGIEIIFLIYPFLNNKKSLKKCGLISTAIIGLIYVWFTFISIFYLGIEISPKFLWPGVTVTESILIPIINSFRYLFMVLWTISTLRLISNGYFALTFGLNSLIKKIDRKTFVFLMYPVIFYLSSKYGNSTTRSIIIDKITPLHVLFNLIYISSIALLIKIRNIKSLGVKGDNNEKK